MQPNQCFESVLLQIPCILQVESASEERFFKGRLLLLLAAALVVVVVVLVVLGGCLRCLGLWFWSSSWLWIVVLVVVVWLLLLFVSGGCYGRTRPSSLQPSKLKQLKVQSPGSLNP